MPKITEMNKMLYFTHNFNVQDIQKWNYINITFTYFHFVENLQHFSEDCVLKNNKLKSQVRLQENGLLAKFLQ